MKFPRFLALCIAALFFIPPAMADDLIDGGFEFPTVVARTPKAKGGDPTKSDPSEDATPSPWASFAHKPGDKGGSLVAGLTGEMGHSGRQSLFVQFDKLTAPYQSAALQTLPLSIRPGSVYRIGIWGRLDPKNPLVATPHTASVKMQVDFFKADKDTITGESIVTVQQMPGSKRKPEFFTTKDWSEFFTEVTTPDDAAFMVVTFRWESGGEQGEINGTVFFDDATVQGPPGVPEPKPEEKNNERRE